MVVRAVLALLVLFSAATVTAQDRDSDLTARRTARAERVATRRAMPPEARATLRAEHSEERERERDLKPARRVELSPLPVPVTIDQAPPPGGKPAGQACPSDAPCTLSWQRSAPETLVVTAVWSATSVRCDDVTVVGRLPPGVALAPWWLCERAFSIEGSGAGFLGFTVSK